MALPYLHWPELPSVEGITLGPHPSNVFVDRGGGTKAKATEAEWNAWVANREHVVRLSKLCADPIIEVSTVCLGFYLVPDDDTNMDEVGPSYETLVRRGDHVSGCVNTWNRDDAKGSHEQTVRELQYDLIDWMQTGLVPVAAYRLSNVVEATKATMGWAKEVTNRGLAEANAVMKSYREAVEPQPFPSWAEGREFEFASVLIRAGAELRLVRSARAIGGGRFDVSDFEFQIRRRSRPTTRCCERDHDGDGNCDVHRAEGR